MAHHRKIRSHIVGKHAGSALIKGRYCRVLVSACGVCSEGSRNTHINHEGSCVGSYSSVCHAEFKAAGLRRGCCIECQQTTINIFLSEGSPLGNRDSSKLKRSTCHCPRNRVNQCLWSGVCIGGQEIALPADHIPQRFHKNIERSVQADLWIKRRRRYTSDIERLKTHCSRIKSRGIAPVAGRSGLH